MNNVLATVAQDLWTEVGYVSKLETLVCAAPVVIWGAGAMEGTVRVIIDVVQIPFASIAGYQTEKIIEKIQNDFKIAKGCVLLTGISMLPLICKTIPYARIIMRLPCYYATYLAYKAIHTQTRNYMQFSHALERAKGGVIALQTSELATKVSQNLAESEYEELFTSLDQNLGKDVTVIQDDLNLAERSLHGTMIYKNWSYTITYFTVKKTVETTKKTVLFAWDTFKKVIASGYVTGAIKFAARQIEKEVLYTVNIPGMPEPRGGSL